MNGETLLCPIEEFLEDYGPYKGVTSADVNKCKKFLIQSNLLNKSGTAWVQYQKKPSEMAKEKESKQAATEEGEEEPKESGEKDKKPKRDRTEPRIFAHLGPIIEKIFHYAGNRRCNDYEFQLVPFTYLESDIGGTNHKMDACIVEEPTKTKLPVNNGVVPHEFKVEREVTAQITVSSSMVQSVLSAHTAFRSASRLLETVSISCVTTRAAHLCTGYVLSSYSTMWVLVKSPSIIGYHRRCFPLPVVFLKISLRKGARF